MKLTQQISSLSQRVDKQDKEKTQTSQGTLDMQQHFMQKIDKVFQQRSKKLHRYTN